MVKNYKVIDLNRKGLQKLVGRMVTCVGIITDKTKPDRLTFGMNFEEKRVVKLNKVKVENEEMKRYKMGKVNLEHLWIHDDDLFEIPKNTKVSFTGIVMSYRKMTRMIKLSYTITNIKEIDVISSEFLKAVA